MKESTKTLEILKKLIAFESVTPKDAGIMEFISQTLTKIGFEKIIIKKFTDSNEKAEDTLNMYASLFEENSGENLMFAGHVDVVPAGKEHLWKFPPFEPTIEDGVLYGRGTSDMKSSIAAFICACEEFLSENRKFNVGNISLLLTGDEEGNSINGTKKMLNFLIENNIKTDLCLVGEPTSEEKIGDTIKNGRRGSISFNLEIEGNQGHIAYPHLAKNPVHELLRLGAKLSSLELDAGTPHFEPSSLQIVKLAPEFGAGNVIPQSASCFFNIRFNNLHTSTSLKALITDFIAKNTSFKFKLGTEISGEAFLNEEPKFVKMLQDAIFQEIGVTSKLSTGGGTSDARFISKYCPTLEAGPLNKTAHKIDENIQLSDLETLKNIYKRLLCKFFIKIS